MLVLVVVLVDLLVQTIDHVVVVLDDLDDALVTLAVRILTFELHLEEFHTCFVLIAHSTVLTSLVIEEVSDEITDDAEDPQTTAARVDIRLVDLTADLGELSVRRIVSGNQGNIATRLAVVDNTLSEDLAHPAVDHLAAYTGQTVGHDSNHRQLRQRGWRGTWTGRQEP